MEPDGLSLTKHNPIFYIGIYLFKGKNGNNRNTTAICEICSKLTIKTPEWRHWQKKFCFDDFLSINVQTGSTAQICKNGWFPRFKDKRFRLRILLISSKKQLMCLEIKIDRKFLSWFN